MREKNYDDIINLPHPTSKKHPRMSAQSRAAQFSPFAALTGYDAAVKETARLTDRRIELDEYEKAELCSRLQMICDSAEKNETVTFTYFVPDNRKDGGFYTTVSGCVKRIDEYERRIVLKDGRKIPLDEIIGIEW